MFRSNCWFPVLSAVILTAACSSEPAEVVRAREVLAERMAEENAYRMYALSIMGGSDAEHARSMIVEAIGGENRAVASEAIRGLSGEPDEQTLAALRTAFTRGGSVQALAASILANRGDTEALDWLAAQLSQGGQVLPVPAMAALSESDHLDSVREMLRGLIWSKDLSTRNEGYSMLGELGAPWTLPLLLEGLDKEFGAERLEPIVALGRVGDPSAAKAVRAWVQTRGLVLASLESLGRLGDAGSMADIEPQLEHEQAVVRAYAAAAAWRLGERDAVMAAIPAIIGDADSASRVALAEQLADLDSPEVTAWLDQLATDQDKEVRAAAYRGLIGRQGPGLVARFAEGAQDEHYEVATIALSGLAEVGGAVDRPALGPLLDTDNPYLAISAAHTILALTESQP